MIPPEIESELGRAVRRWRQLPLDRAAAALPGVHALLAEIAGEELPDLGPAVVMDQLRVVVYDACASEGGGAGLAERLASLRLGWSG
ncbi:hypothetical protein O9K63_08440 [Janibacter cremeus]|uniref:hypothetical protein n=1 Tax=Janibacter cremeus TaxID=1285192 RepID=UPI0023F8E8C4|nr:hypothetical protein [Janibacter cremeus]WEV76642.1 hypothetical protein O9K63_08440 [Janibacter cremeus]